MVGQGVYLHDERPYRETRDTYWKREKMTRRRATDSRGKEAYAKIIRSGVEKRMEREKKAQEREKEDH